MTSPRRPLNSGNQRAWNFRITTTNLEAFASDDGTDVAPAFLMTGAFTFVINTWYHVAWTRDGNDDFRMFVDGTQVGSTINSTITLHNSTSDLQIGRFRSTPNQRPFYGNIDEFRITKGVARYTSNFTAPTVPFPIA